MERLIDGSTARRAKPYEGAPVGADVGIARTVSWAAVFLAGGILVAGGWLPGSGDWSTGPRIGVATLLTVLGATVLGLGLVPIVLRRTTRPADYKGGCPVGATCPCGHFNFKPRTTCRQCGSATAFAPKA
jgi:hypothetical protein